jgi:hypothetical protein
MLQVSKQALACIRRGPFAIPDEHEMVEYLLSRKRTMRVTAEQHGVYHVIAYQRRLNAIKNEFFRRDNTTPLGKLQDWWDRTEAQQRGSLHSHILCWFEQRDLNKFTNYSALRGIPRTAPGNDCRQRPKSQHVPDLKDYQEDNIYFHNKVARIWCECVRPYVNNEDNIKWGGFDVVTLRFAGLARAVQSRTYLHQCSLRYCLHNRSSCRFFFPWPKMNHQAYDHNTERTALQRRLPSDDQWVNPHNPCLAVYATGSCHVLPFDPRFGGDTCRTYASKYAAKDSIF